MPNVEELRKRREAEAHRRDEQMREERRKQAEREKQREKQDYERQRYIEMGIAKQNQSKVEEEKARLKKQENLVKELEQKKHQGDGQ